MTNEESFKSSKLLTISFFYWMESPVIILENYNNGFIFRPAGIWKIEGQQQRWNIQPFPYFNKPGFSKLRTFHSANDILAYIHQILILKGNPLKGSAICVQAVEPISITGE